MGHNVNLAWLLNLPGLVNCPRCKKEIDSGFDEYDIDEGHPSVKTNGHLRLYVHCPECDHEFCLKYKTEAIAR